MSSIVHTKILAEHDRYRTNLQVLRGIATLEVMKGMIVLLAAVGILLMVRREDPWYIADGLLRLLHISPDHHFAQVFLDWADSLTNAKIWTVAAAALSYPVLRFIEAYGLWYARAWAEWIALISGALYLPFEIYKLVHRQSLFHVAVLLINLAVVFYMAYALKTGQNTHHHIHPQVMTALSVRRKATLDEFLAILLDGDRHFLLGPMVLIGSVQNICGRHRWINGHCVAANSAHFGR